MQDPWVVGKKFGSFPSIFFTQPFQYFQIVNLVDCLSIWYKFIMNNPSNIKKSQQHHFDSWFGPTEFFWLCGIGSLPLCTSPLRFRVLLVDPCFTCDYTAQNVILPLQKVLANCDSAFVIWWAPLGPFWTISFPVFPSLTRNLMFVHCSNSSSDILGLAHQNTRRQ